MQKTVDMPTRKIKSLQELIEILEIDRKNGFKIVQCHGVFDLLHPGHVRHFRAAKEHGDKLVVSLTPDRFVNKGPGRPAFTEALRLESIAALQDVDYVVLNDSPDAVSVIKKIKPSVYVKGDEYSNHAADITGKISEEAEAVASIGGEIRYTNDIVFSSSSLLNTYFDNMSPEAGQFLRHLKTQYSIENVLAKIDALQDLNVLIIGDAILDEYQFIQPLGLSGKGLHMVVRCQEKEMYLGGSLIIANHVAQFTSKVTLLTALGKNCPHLSFIRTNLDPQIKLQLSYLNDTTTLLKKRYVHKDGNALSKFFETYSGQDECLTTHQTEDIIRYLRKSSPQYDLVLVCDFGNGFTNPQIIDAISDLPNFLAINTQTNSGNRGFNAVTNYRRADYIALNEAEFRLSAHDKTSSLEGLAFDLSHIMNCENISVTQGTKGVFCYSNSHSPVQLPAFATNSIDRIGAGDCFLSLSALCLAKKYSPIFAGFIGSVAAAMSVQIVGNQESIRKTPLCKFITRLMK